MAGSPRHLPGRPPAGAAPRGAGRAATGPGAHRPIAQAGFTLVELILVIVIAGVLAATLTVFFRPAMDSYLAVRSRADLVEQGDTALRRMIREVRAAVPNSIRIPGTQCFEFAPTIAGGRYRQAPDTAADSGPGCTPGSSCSAPLDITQPVTAFDVLTPFTTVPAVGDEVVIGNQSPEAVYAGSNRAAITAVATPAASQGRHRLSIASTQFPAGYNEARFTVVPASGPVFYVCSGADGTLDAAGNGKGTLWRRTGHGWNATYPTGCPAAGGDVLATQVQSCQFVYDPNQGATQQNGFIALQLTLARQGETTTLVFGAHVANAP